MPSSAVAAEVRNRTRLHTAISGKARDWRNRETVFMNASVPWSGVAFALNSGLSTHALLYTALSVAGDGQPEGELRERPDQALRASLRQSSCYRSNGWLIWAPRWAWLGPPDGGCMAFLAGASALPTGVLTSLNKPTPIIDGNEPYGNPASAR